MENLIFELRLPKLTNTLIKEVNEIKRLILEKSNQQQVTYESKKVLRIREAGKYYNNLL